MFVIRLRRRVFSPIVPNFGQFVINIQRIASSTLTTSGCRVAQAVTAIRLFSKCRIRKRISTDFESPAKASHSGRHRGITWGGGIKAPVGAESVEGVLSQLPGPLD